MFGDSFVARTMVFRWHSQFAVGEESIEAPEWSGRPGTQQMNENIAWVAAVLKDNSRASCCMIVENTGILKTIIHHILSDDLKKQKLCARFVPHALTAEQREQHVVHAKDLTIPVLYAPIDFFVPNLMLNNFYLKHCLI